MKLKVLFVPKQIETADWKEYDEKQKYNRNQNIVNENENSIEKQNDKLIDDFIEEVSELCENYFDKFQ